MSRPPSTQAAPSGPRDPDPPREDTLGAPSAHGSSSGPLRRFRLVLRVDGRKVTRHVRALDGEDALEQAHVILAASPPPTLSRAVLATVTGSAGRTEVLSVTQLGLA